MLKKTRCDGSPIRDLPLFTVLMPFVMPTRAASVIFFDQEIDVTETQKRLKEINRELIKRREIVTLFDVVLAAAVRGVALRPKVNRFISGKRFYQRNQIVFNFVAKKELSDEGEEVNVKVPFEPSDTIYTVARRVHAYVKRAISEEGMDNDRVVRTLGRLPHFVKCLVAWGLEFLDRHNLMPSDMIESDPCYCSVFLANVGSFDLEAPFHHLYDRGNCPIFIAMGKVKAENRLESDGGVAERKILRLRYSFDDRVVDGVYMAKALNYIKGFVEDVRGLEEVPSIDPRIIAELNLRRPSDEGLSLG
jgi:Pyruvate/2-oxoglutarate dehydrogenase complex, dihydrolipoamide acyltransferase (E2) component, and related enzymes